MKKTAALALCLIAAATSSATAQMFYNPGGRSFDSTGSATTRTSSTAPKQSEDEFDYKEPEAYEVNVSPEIRERIRADAAYIVGEPDEALCYGIARKSPKKRAATIDGFAHTGNCGSLNETGMKEVRDKLFNVASYDMNVTKVVSCITTPRLALRYRKGFDFVDVILSGGNCPAVFFMYGGDTKEFSAKPIKDWLDTFINAVSQDLEPVNPEEAAQAGGNLFRKRDENEADAAPEPAQPAAPKRWGRRAQ